VAPGSFARIYYCYVTFINKTMAVVIPCVTTCLVLFFVVDLLLKKRWKHKLAFSKQILTYSFVVK